MPKLDFTKELFKDDPEVADFVPAEFDAKSAIDQFKKHERRIQIMAKEVEDLEITDDDSNERAVAMGTVASKANKELEAQRVSIVKPHNDFVKQVNNTAKMYTGKIQDLIIKPLKAKVGEYLAKKELAEKKAQEEARKAAEKLQEKMNKEAAKAGVEAPDVPKPKVKDKAVGPVKTTPGTGFTQKRWTYEVENINKVPRDYLKLDEGAVTRAIRAGAREIPGLKIFQRSSTAFRSG